MSGTAAPRHSATHVMVCAILPATAIYSFIGTLLDFSNTFLLYRWIHPLLFLLVLVYIPSLPFCYASFCANFHTSVPILMYFIRLGFTLQPISSFLFFSSLAFAVKTWWL